MRYSLLAYIHESGQWKYRKNENDLKLRNMLFVTRNQIRKLNSVNHPLVKLLLIEACNKMTGIENFNIDIQI